LKSSLDIGCACSTANLTLWGRAAGGRGAYAALDAVGGATTQLVTSAVRPGGTVLIYGALSGPTLTLNTFDIFLRKRLEARAGSGSGSQLWLHAWQAWPHAWLSCLLGAQPKAVTLPAGSLAAGCVVPCAAEDMRFRVFC